MAEASTALTLTSIRAEQTLLRPNSSRWAERLSTNGIASIVPAKPKLLSSIIGSRPSRSVKALSGSTITAITVKPTEKTCPAPAGGMPTCPRNRA